ncbi:breast cancer type 2 susceptibility protein [Pseudorasbora parva]|uniref:breast cancer type 2 susceptibility protein n=1 Tax=Pseudorasbora parva TaxID=51549 RepID=UPI00351E2B54
MFENFFHQIDKELGPLNPDWFKELTVKVSQDVGRPDSSKAEREEDTVKAPETSALASQLYSTPKIFKQQQFQSPDSIPNEESPYEVTNGDLSAFPWTESSPCLFGSAKDSQRLDRSCEKPRDCFGQDTPKRSLARSAKLISESLGAQINPDLSWTSSFNTPSSLTPTVILPKTEDCCPSSSGLKDKEAIFVRKLFPSLSKVSANTASLNDTFKQDAKSETIQVDDLGENPVCSPNASPDTSGLWKQKVPNAIEDGDVRTTVQNVLDGAEDALSIFFSNSTSTLRRIKTKERIRRRITYSSKDVKSLVLTSEPDEILKSDVEAKSPSKNKDTIQWTPLSLSESILNRGCSGVSLINNHNTVASSETNGGTVFNHTAESSQTFSQCVRSYPEEAEHQKTLLDNSPSFMLPRKPRKFVYQVPSSDLSKTVIEHKAALPVFGHLDSLDHNVKESSSVEKVSSDLNESRFASHYALNNQTQLQAAEPLSTELHDFDHGLDMTQLSKAFAEDFTQEIRPEGLLDMPVKSDQNDQVQPKAELKEYKVNNHNDISNSADKSANSPNKSTVMLTTFDISHDSGCPTTFSDLDATTTLCTDIKESCPTFETANNKAISIPSEAILKAKTSLDDAAGDGLSFTLNQTTPKHEIIETLCKPVSGSTNATRSHVGQFVFPNQATITCVSDTPKSVSPKNFKVSISSYSSPQSNESDYKTGSKRKITASDVSLQTETLLKEKLWRDSLKCIHQKLDFKRSAERQTVFDVNHIHKPNAVDSSGDDVEKNGTLTASQKADVTALCNLLEEANSQHEFTQFKPTNVGSENKTTEREWDPDIVNGIDFDDSFNCDFVKGKHPVKKDTSSVNRSDHIHIVYADKLCTISKETRNGIVPLSVTEDNSLVEGMKNVLCNFSDNTQFHCLGFKTAEGKLIQISEKSLDKAKHFFEEDGQEVKVDIGEIKSECSDLSELSANKSDSISSENKTNLKNENFSCAYVNAHCKEIHKQVAGNGEMEQNCLDEKTDVVCVDANSHFGFSTAKGVKLKLSENTLLQARKLNDVDSLESQTYILSIHATGKHDASISTTSLQKTKTVSWSETSIKRNQKSDSVVVNQTSDGPDIPSFSRENVFQEQKSSNDAKEACAKIFPSETFVPRSGQGYGFQTASGKGVSFSASALKKAKDIFKDCDSHIDSLDSAKIMGKNDKLVEIFKQTNASTSDVVEAKTVFVDTVLINDFSLHSSLDHQPEKKICKKKDFQNEFSKHLSELLPLNGNCGFSTASGKKVSISAGALQRAKDVLSESADGFSCVNDSQKTKQVVDNQTDSFSSGEHKGFCTAGGKKVAVSAAGIQGAKYLFRDCEEESLSSKDLQHQNCKGFSNVSENTLVKEKVAFAGSSDVSFSHEPETGNSSGKNLEFSTAGGKKVAISATALQRAKSLFNDYEEENLSSGSLQHQGCKSVSTASGKDVTVSENALREVRAAFAGCEDASFTHEPKNSPGNNIGFSTAGGKKVAISATALQRAKSLFNDCEDENLDSGSLHHQDCKGFSTASGKDVTVSENALLEVRAAFAGCEDASFTHEPKNSPGNNIGFSTAGGKKVAISATALQRAKSLFNDCEEDNLASGSLQHQGCKGFSTASGKDVTVSENALREVRAAFAGCEDPSSHGSKNSSENNLGFSTAGGKKVTISATALHRAKSLFKSCEEENTSTDFVLEKLPPQTKSSHRKSEDVVDGNLKFEQLNKKNCGFSTASGKGVSVSKVALEEASKLFRDSDAQVTTTDNQLLQSDFSKRCTKHKERQTETTLHSSPSKATQNIPAQLDLHSLDFNSCTDTQQKYFEQEAMACTEALLADDDLNESTKLVMSENTDYKKCPSIHDIQTQVSFDLNKRRKRQFESSSVAGQPPLKRQLLSEFDQTLDSESSGLTPLKSCPNGTLKDRRVFKYNVHLKPNVTAPDWHHMGEKSNDLEKHCTVSVQNRLPSDTKEGVSVPPFQKVMMTGTSNCQNVSKVASGFIPPFKKENKEKTDHSNQMDQKVSTSTSHSDSVAQYCDEKNLHEGFKPKLTTSVESLMKTRDSEEKDSEAWQETIDLARNMQDMRLRKKKRQTIRPLPGRLYLAKTSGAPRICLRDAVGCKYPGQCTKEEDGVHQKVSEITSENAESFRFDCNDFFKRELLNESGALQLADGGWLVPDSKGTVGKDEFYSALCDTPGVDPKLISDTWVFNHYRWIVWKRASMERTFPVLMGSMCLTPEQVLLQLKFRYDVEVDLSQRSALRRIMERDDTPAKTLVLCVCGVAKTCQNPEKPVKDEKSPNAKMESCVIWLTDGWYAIKGILDPPLSAMLNKGRLRIGDKIVTSGAELVGSQEACSPLEAPESLMLKISANSTRRARWDTKLGYYRDPRPIRLLLSSLFTAGGVVSCVNILVLRSYPTQWMEKKPSGVFIFRNDRAEDREARKHSNSKHKSMDLLISKIQTQFEKEMEGKKKSRRQRRTFSRHEIEALQDGEELYEAMEQDPAIETHLNERQMEAVSKYRCCLGERSQAELQERVQKAVMEVQEAEGGCPNRDVTPVWKLSITDANDLQNDCVYMLNIWRPSRDLYGLLREGRRYRAYHLATSEGKKRSGIAHIQLTATKKTLFQDIEVSPEWLHQHFRARECVHFRELHNPQFSSPCGEVDIVGCIVSIEGKQGNCPVLHLVDENFDLVSVRTYSSLEQLAVEELVKPRALIALSNLQVRPLSGPVPSLYAGEQAVFSVNPKESHLQEAMDHLKTFVQTCEQYFSVAEEKVSDVVPAGVLGCFQSPRTPGVQSNPKMNGMVTPQQKSSGFSPFTPLNRRTPIFASNSEGKDPKNLKRRRGLDYLSRIPSPPPLTSLTTRASPCINKTFNPPRRSVTPKPPQNQSPRASRPPSEEEKWVHDEELVMIDTQALLDGLREG